MNSEYKHHILLKLSLEATARVNHDLLGAMHVVNFCNDEMNDTMNSFDESRLRDYGHKLSVATGQMEQTVKSSRILNHGFKRLLSNEDKVFDLTQALEFSKALALIIPRARPDINYSLENSKRLRSLSFGWLEALCLVPFFNWLSSNEGEINFFEDDSADMLAIRVPKGQLRTEMLADLYLKSEFPIANILELLGEIQVLERLAHGRDIIGDLRTNDKEDTFFVHLNLFQRLFA
tara:strand:+ start:30644 stop:31345 length:702 start_codon:yes stop_codon:yes gene_type:complete